MDTFPIFIGGAGRSGTTLLRVILDSHPHIACGPELKITPVITKLWNECQTIYAPFLKQYGIGPDNTNDLYRRLIVSILDSYRNTVGKTRIAEKTPNNIKIFHHLHRLFPQSPLIHVVRDGRDVVASLLTMRWQTPQGDPIEYTKDASKAAQFWLDAINSGEKFKSANPSHSGVYYEIRYEDIVLEPEKTLRKLFSFIKEPWDPAVLNYYENNRDLAEESSAEQVKQHLYTSSIGRWKNDLSKRQKEEVKSVAGAKLVELGYATDLSW